MRCYCENCKTEYKFSENGWDIDDMCPICGNQDPDYDLIPIPDYETPKQYEQRTGVPYPDNGVVFVLFCGVWMGKMWCHAKEKQNNDPYYYEAAIVIADPPLPPPDDWRPE